MENTGTFGYSLGHRRSLAKQGFFIERFYHATLD